MLLPLQAHLPILMRKLLMPGPVVKGHAKYESECTKCHVLFKKGGQNEKCLECHKTVGIDLKKKKGFHGRNFKVKGSECKHCHTDHKGRGADISFSWTWKPSAIKRRISFSKVNIVPLNAATVMWPVKNIGKHPPAVSIVIKKTILTFGRLGKTCSKCHSEQSWRKGTVRPQQNQIPA